MHGFPAALASFIGRAGARREVAGLLGECRLVTVTGPGGVGKTRLAGQVARLVAGRFADGAWLAELAPVRDPAQVAAVVAAALGIREQPGVRASGALARVLAGQQLLLVLDNCEHVIGAAAELCGGLLAACDDVRVLATSREPLAVGGEARYRLGPLTLPAPGDAAGGGRSEAVALFADRARRADARFALDGENGPTVARLVARLDGMPLAIELAAARVEALGVAQLLDRIGDRFALLTGGDRLAADRQRSLAATVEWSYQLLDDHEQRVFRRVSVFPAGFTLDGAEAVAGEAAGPAVVRLVDCSLLTPPRAGPDGRPRYRMLETLRAYAAGLLAETGEQDGAAAALAGYALQVAGQAAAGSQSGDGELAAARWLDAEDATMRQALGWAVAHDPALALRLADALGWWWVLRGRLAGEYRLLCQAAGRAEAGSGGWCAAQFWLGWAAQFSADLAAALGHFTAVRDAVAGRPPSRALTVALAGRAGVLRLMGRTAEAAGDARRALVLAREIGDPVGEFLALVDLSLDAHYAGDHDEAVRLARQAGQITAGIPGTLARGCSSVLTIVLADAGDLAEAERVSAAGLARARDAGDLRNQALLLPRIVDLDLRAGRTGDAAAHLREGLHLAVRTGSWLELAHRPVPVRGAVRRDRARRRGPDAVGRVRRGGPARGTHRAALVRVPLGGTDAPGPAGAGTRPGAGGRGPRRGDEHDRRRRVRPDAHRPRLTAARGVYGPGKAQRPGTGAGHPGRPGPHQRPDRRRAVYQRPHRRLAPGPDPGQDRLPPPRRPDPPGPQRAPGLAGPAEPPVPVGHPTPAAAVPERGPPAPAPRAARPTRLLPIEANAESPERSGPCPVNDPGGGQ